MTDLRKTARITGLWYLGLAVTGILGFMVIRPLLQVPGSAAETAKNLVEREALARLGVALELGIVATQAFAAIWFYRLFRSVDSVWAGSLAAFGLVNAVAILASAALRAAAVDVAVSPSLSPAGGVAATVQLLHLVSDKLWSVGSLFFGLWLLPMGQLARASGRMPKALGWTLLLGGGGYVLSAFLANGVTNAPAWLVAVLSVPATIGEFWMVGYLLFVGVGSDTSSSGGGALQAAKR